MITAVAAIDKNRGIGKNGELLIHIKEDMKHFSSLTTGHTVVMGRKTLESFPGKKPLKNRKNVVLTRNADFTCPGAVILLSIGELLSYISKETDEVFIIGGGEIYSLLLPVCDRMILTQIDKEFDADAFFPEFDESEWQKNVLKTLSTESGISYSFVEYKKKQR